MVDGRWVWEPQGRHSAQPHSVGSLSSHSRVWRTFGVGGFRLEVSFGPMSGDYRGGGGSGAPRGGRGE